MPAPGYGTYGEPLDLENQIIVDGEAEIKSDKQYIYHGPDVDVKSLHWRKVDGPFVSIWLHNVPWGGEDAMAAPNAEVCAVLHVNGIIDPTTSIYLFIE